LGSRERTCRLSQAWMVLRSTGGEALQPIVEVAGGGGDGGGRRGRDTRGAHGAAQRPHRGEERGRTHQGHDDLAADMVRRDDAEPPEQPAADDGAEAARHEVAEDAELAATAHDGQHEPARAQPRHRPRQQLPHSVLLR